MRCPACGRDNKWDRSFCEGCAEELFTGAGAHLEPPRAKDRNRRRRQAVVATARRTADTARTVSADLASQARSGYSELGCIFRRGLLVLSAVIPGLGHYQLKLHRLARQLFLAFLASLATWLLFTGTLIGTLAQFAVIATIGTSVLDVLRHDVDRETRRRLQPSQILLSLALVLAVIAVVPAFFSIFWERAIVTQPVMQLVPPESGMQPEAVFKVGDRIFFRRFAYRRRLPERGDVVLADVNNYPTTQRIIAGPGDELSLEDGRIFVNGESLPSEAYPLQPETPVRTEGGDIVTEENWYRLLRNDEYAVWGVDLPYVHDDATASITPFIVSRYDIHGKGWILYSPFYRRHFIRHINLTSN